MFFSCHFVSDGFWFLSILVCSWKKKCKHLLNNWRAIWVRSCQRQCDGKAKFVMNPCNLLVYISFSIGCTYKQLKILLAYTQKKVIITFNIHLGTCTNKCHSVLCCLFPGSWLRHSSLCVHHDSPAIPLPIFCPFVFWSCSVETKKTTVLIRSQSWLHTLCLLSLIISVTNVSVSHFST